FEQPEGIAYVILDSKLDDVPNWKRSVRSDQPPISANSLPELAAKVGIDARELAATIAASIPANTAAGPDGALKPLETDGLATKPGFVPRKSNWSRPIDKPPF